MSSREHLIQRAKDAIAVDIALLADERHEIAESVVDALMPVITEAKQMKDVPERSILIVPVMGGVVPVRWQNDLIYGDLKADKMPIEAVWVIDRYGPMTVVWMP